MADHRAPSEDPENGAPRWIREFVRELRGWTEVEPGVRAALLYGSYPAGRADHFSDIDLVLVRSEQTSSESIAESLQAKFPVGTRLHKEGRDVFLLRNPPIKLEISTISPAELDRVQGLFEGSRIRDGSASILTLKEPELRQEAVRWSRVPGEPPTGTEAEREGLSFLYYFEEFHPAFHRGDHYRAFFLYSLAFYKLGSFLAAVNGVGDFLYAPERLVDLLDKTDSSIRERFEHCAPLWGRDLSPLLLKKELMFDLFEDALRQHGTKVEGLLDTAHAVRQFVTERYPPLWRWRDIGDRGKTAPRRIFRAARLDRYPTDLVASFLRNEGIRTIVDLRTDTELQRHHYPEGALTGVRYVRIPVWPSLSFPPGSSEEERLHYMYGHFTEDPGFPTWINSLLAEVSRSENLPMAIHCHAGADRTGILVATLLKLAGASDDEVIDDYLITSGHVRRKYIEAFLRHLRDQGGVFPLLQSRGIPSQLIEEAVAAITSLECPPIERVSK